MVRVLRDDGREKCVVVDVYVESGGGFAGPVVSPSRCRWFGRTLVGCWRGDRCGRLFLLNLRGWWYESFVGSHQWWVGGGLGYGEVDYCIRTLLCSKCLEGLVDHHEGVGSVCTRYYLLSEFGCECLVLPVR
jgi:hypothetical protein